MDDSCSSRHCRPSKDETSFGCSRHAVEMPNSVESRWLLDAINANDVVGRLNGPWKRLKYLPFSIVHCFETQHMSTEAPNGTFRDHLRPKLSSIVQGMLPLDLGLDVNIATDTSP